MQMLHHLYKDLNISRLWYLWGSWKQSLMLPEDDCITIYGDGGTSYRGPKRTELYCLSKQYSSRLWQCYQRESTLKSTPQIQENISEM